MNRTKFCWTCQNIRFIWGFSWFISTFFFQDEMIYRTGSMSSHLGPEPQTAVKMRMNSKTREHHRTNRFWWVMMTGSGLTSTSWKRPKTSTNIYRLGKSWTRKKIQTFLLRWQETTKVQIMTVNLLDERRSADMHKQNVFWRNKHRQDETLKLKTIHRVSNMAEAASC